MNKPQHSKTSLVLMEMMINLFFFCILVTICTQFFVKSHTIRKTTVDLTHGVNLVTSVTECYRGCEGSLDDFLAYYPDAKVDVASQTATIFFDSDFKLCTEGAQVYFIEVIFTATDTDCLADVSFYKTGSKQSIYALSTHLHKKIHVGGVTDE